MGQHAIKRPPTRRRTDWSVAGALLLLALWSDASWAAASLDNADGVINEIGRQFQGQLVQWGTTIHTAATRIFWALALLSLVWLGAQLIIRKGDISDVVGELLRYAMFLGLFRWLLENAVAGANIANGLVNGLLGLGNQASGLPASFDAAQMMQVGLDVIDRSISGLSISSPSTWFAFLIGLGILIIMAVISVNFILVKFGAYILIYAGIILLGFGGARWTSEIAINYFKACISQGLRLLTMACIVSASLGMLQSYVELLGTGPIPLRTSAAFLVVTIVLAMFITKVPDLVAGVMSGHIHGAGLGSVSAASVTGAAIAATSAAITAINSLGREVAGLAMAMKEAKKSADSGGESSSGAHATARGSIAQTSGSAAATSAPTHPQSPSASMGGSASVSASSAAPESGIAPTGANAVQGSGSTHSSSAQRGGEYKDNDVSQGSGSIGAGNPDVWGRHTQEQSPSPLGFFGELASGIASVERARVEHGTYGGKVSVQIRNRRHLAEQSKGVQAANKEVDPQAEISAFVKGRS